MGASWNNPYSPSDPKYKEYELAHDRNEEMRKQTEMMNQSALEQQNFIREQKNNAGDLPLQPWPMYVDRDEDGNPIIVQVVEKDSSDFWLNVALSPLWIGLFFLAAWMVYEIFSCISF
jgi:hypothetical protein